MTNPPSRSRDIFAIRGRVTPYALEHLNVANDVRIARGRLRYEIRKHPRLALEVIQDPPSYVATARVEHVLRGVHRLGDKLIARYCAKAGVNPISKLKDLTVRQRLDLADALQESGCFR